jgi:nascent polypeptide-associated complex subunit alpha
MFPGGMNPKNMGRMMRQMGIKTEEINAKSVEVFLEDGKKLVFKNPQIQLMQVQGQKTYTLMVCEQTNVSEEEAKKALEEFNGDIAKAIEKLNS